MKGEFPLVSLAVCTLRYGPLRPVHTTLEQFENRVYSENPSNILRPGTQSQRNAKTEQSPVILVCPRKTRDHVIIVKSSFSNSFVFGGQFLEISVDGRPNRRNN